jgi:hypothetical protein
MEGMHTLCVGQDNLINQIRRFAFHLHVVIKNAVKIDYGNRDSTDKLWVIELSTSKGVERPY